MLTNYRHEIKFFCREIDLKVIENDISGIMRLDSHVKCNSSYVIRSVYFDGINNQCFYDNENGIEPREKFRIRMYDYSDEFLLLEKKSKNYGLTIKESHGIDLSIYNKMIHSEDLFDLAGESKVLDEWIRINNRLLLKPAVIIEYDRTPYVYGLGNVRVTFDRNIRASNSIKEFKKKAASMGFRFCQYNSIY